MPAGHPPQARRRAIDLARQPGVGRQGRQGTGHQRVRPASLDVPGRCRYRLEGGLVDQRARGVGPALVAISAGRNGERDPQARQCLLRRGEPAPKMGFRLVRELAEDGYDVAVARWLGVSRSGYYDWLGRPPSARDLADAYLANLIIDIHTMSRCSSGAPRVHADSGGGWALGPQGGVRLLAAAAGQQAWDQPSAQAATPTGCGGPRGPRATQVLRSWA